MVQTVSKECIRDGCIGRVPLNGYWNICIDCYADVPDHIPIEQANLYSDLKNEKENGDNRD